MNELIKNSHFKMTKKIKVPVSSAWQFDTEPFQIQTIPNIYILLQHSD